MHQILPLTSARFFAALAVVIFHYDRKLMIFPASIADFGYEPVTFFFILSGFVLTYAHGRPEGLNITAAEFKTARLARIMPAYLLALLIAAPFAARSLSWPILLVPPMLQAWWPDASLLWNAPAWSLSNEMFFYALFPAAWAIFRPLSDRWSIGLACTAVLSVSVFRAIAPHDTTIEWHNFIAYFPLLNLPQFIVGITLGELLYSHGPLERSGTVFGVSCVAICAVIALKPTCPWLGNDIVLAAVFGATIYSLAGIAGSLKSVLSSRPLVALGSASYALYILHVPIWLWWNHLTRVTARLDIDPRLDFCIYLGITIAASIAVDAFIERPCIRFFRRQYRTIYKPALSS